MQSRHSYPTPGNWAELAISKIGSLGKEELGHLENWGINESRDLGDAELDTWRKEYLDNWRDEECGDSDAGAMESRAVYLPFDQFTGLHFSPFPVWNTGELEKVETNGEFGHQDLDIQILSIFPNSQFCKFDTWRTEKLGNVETWRIDNLDTG